MVDTIVDNISLRTERKIEMDLQLSVATSADKLANFAAYLRNQIANESSILNQYVFISESGKQFHVIHAECYVSMESSLETFQMLREKLNLAAVAYANQHQINFAEKA